MDLSELTIATFEPHVGDTFRDADAGVGYELLAVNDLTEIARNVPEGQRAPFSLFFLGPLEPVVPQGIRPLDHDSLGRLEIFLVPVEQLAEGIRYQAVFS